MDRMDYTEYGVTDKGFRRKLFTEILGDMITRSREVFGVKIDTSETSFYGQLIRIFAEMLSIEWEKLEEVYYSPFVNTAEGADLDNVGMYLTITRRPATKSKGMLTVYGKPGTVIEKGFRVATESGIAFETLETAEIKDEPVEIPIESIGAGESNNVGAGAITVILNPRQGIDNVINLYDTEGGLDMETDPEFRARYKQSYSRGGGSTAPAIEAALLDIDKVVDARVKENTTMQVVDGIPPKAIECFVFGGEDEEIAKTIYQHKAGGIEAYGSLYVDVKDEMEEIHKIGFSRANVKDIYVKLKIKRGKGFIATDIPKRAVVNYIGGTDEDGIKYRGLKLGDDVVYTKVINAVMELGNIEDIEVELSSDNSTFVKGNIDIDNNTIARTSTDKVTVEYV